jgi:hypothetical protein
MRFFFITAEPALIAPELTITTLYFFLIRKTTSSTSLSTHSADIPSELVMSDEPTLTTIVFTRFKY